MSKFTSLTVVVAAALLGPLLASGKRSIAPVLLGELIADVLRAEDADIPPAQLGELKMREPIPAARRC